MIHRPPSILSHSQINWRVGHPFHPPQINWICICSGHLEMSLGIWVRFEDAFLCVCMLWNWIWTCVKIHWNNNKYHLCWNEPCMHIHTNTDTHTYIHAYILHIYIYIYIYIQHIHACTYMHTCTHAKMQTCTYTHTRTQHEQPACTMDNQLAQSTCA